MYVKHNLSELHKGLEGVMAAKAQAAAGSTTAIVKKAKIQKVPAFLLGREGMKKHFEPRWISFGPIHYGNSKFKVAEKYKLELVAKSLRDGGYSSANELYDKIESKMSGVKGCFDEQVIRHFDDEGLKWILFYDRCVILQFINSCFKKDHLQELKIKNDQVAFTKHDLFLLENQIPYQVLQVLLNHSTKKDQLQKSLKEFIEAMNVMAPDKNHRSFNNAETIETNSEPAHLLDLLRLALLHPLRNPPEKKKDETKIEVQDETIGVQQTFRSVQDLKAAGIDLKPSKTCSLRDIKFSSIRFVGELELPRLIVDDLMAPKFLNLIAYEMCPDNTQTEYEVTSYICFLDSLIDYPADVKELRTSDILHNLLGCDEEVAKLFNEIATDLVPNLEVYEKVIQKIEEHYKNKWTTWIAQVINDHFSTPWTFVAFLGVVLALFMSGIQTWFTVYPAPGS